MINHSIIIVANSRSRLEKCLESVKMCTRDTVDGDYEIIIVPNSPIIKKQWFWKKYFSREKYLPFDKEESFGKCVNRGVMASRGQFFIVLHDDTIVTDGWNVRMGIAFDKREKAGCIGPLTGKANSIQAIRKYQSHNYYHDTEIAEKRQLEVSEEGNEPTCAKIDSFCFMIHRGLWAHVGQFKDLPEEFCLTDWIIKAWKMGFAPYIDRFTYVHHTDKCIKQDLSIGSNEIIKEHGIDALEYVENNLYLRLLR